METREHLLDTAELLFHEQGVSRTSLHQIAEAAGLTRGAIYWHFKDKADVFNAMMERVTLPMEQPEAPMSGTGRRSDALSVIRRKVLNCLSIAATDDRTRRVFQIATQRVEYVGELIAVRDRHLAVRNTWLKEIETSLRDAVKQDHLRLRTTVAVGALGLYAILDGLMQNWMLDPESFDLLRVGRQSIDTYLAGLLMAGDTASRTEECRGAGDSRRSRG
ncbi:MAG: bacterial regulatory s, tetR family protein [Rhizobacter sp.]|jgi:TetR/AcrR family acrAB operon transcriptional repressor|nr:bacterial regulatory s, tetR family protein [Rhizobacter sp.]